MKKALYASLLAIIFLFSCQENEELEQIQDKKYTVSIMRELENLYLMRAMNKTMKRLKPDLRTKMK